MSSFLNNLFLEKIQNITEREVWPKKLYYICIINVTEPNFARAHN